jgi:hypothetical protein
MAGNKKTVNLLPEYLRTTKNSKFLSSTLDPLISSPELERVDGYIGSKITPNYEPSTDFYLKQQSLLRQNYSLEPALVFKNKTSEINDVISYDDIINEIANQEGYTNDLSSIFISKYYSYDPLIDWDKFINFAEYYWLPNGPDFILIRDDCVTVETQIIGQLQYFTDYLDENGNPYPLSNGMLIKFQNLTYSPNYSGKVCIVEGVGESINLIDFDLLVSNEKIATVFNETFDSTAFDEFPFDGDRKLPINPEYITINKASQDLNPWTRYNRWFHKQVIEVSSKINNKIPVLNYSDRAKRPIIEFKANIQLYNFGKKGIKNVDLIDTDTVDVFKSVEGSLGYYVDGVLLEEGFRVIFNADLDSEVKGKIFKVEYDISLEVPVLHLVPDEDTVEDLDSVAVNYGNKQAGTTYYYSAEKTSWIFAQQHTVLNEAPLFDLFDNNKISYTKLSERNNFLGNKIFGYDIGTGTPDSILGFPLKYQNSVGIGSYVFKNYFMSDVISITVDSISTKISTGVTYIKINNLDNTESLLNVWNKNLQITKLPVIETQEISTTTSTITINSLNVIQFNNVTAYVNNVKTPIYTTTGSSLIQFTNNVVLKSNDVVTLKIDTNQVPNKNGYVQTPLGLTNNPLNGPITDLTFSELSDHLATMIEKIPNFVGTFPGSSNLRDLYNYSQYGSRLIINANPLAFTSFFLGKKSHNVIDAIKSTATHYNQFKMNLLKFAIDVGSDFSPADALEEILKQINKNKTAESPYYRSDMVGYGPDKIVKTYTITDVAENEFYISQEFRLDKLSFESILAYQNNNLLIANKDYYFDYNTGFIVVSKSLNLNDIISIVYYKSTLGCYVPPTPTKLGLYPKFYPELYLDKSYITPVNMIRCHDGSVIKAYNDYRDNIILEYEKRVYNNIKTTYNSKIFDVKSIEKGAFRFSNFTKTQIDDVLKLSFMRWSGQYSVKYSTNTTFDELNPFTWNYANTVDVINNEELTGSWRAIYNYFFDTDAPNIRPWEMLGFGEEPSWWKSNYGSAPYTSANFILWNDLKDGIVRDPAGSYVLPQYSRENLLSIIPVDNNGNLLPPSSFLTTNNTYQDKSLDWKFGDYSPAETTWRKSSEFPFAINVAAALLNPCDYLSWMYDVSRTGLNKIGQITYLEDDLYLNLKKLIIDNTEQTSGYSVFVCEHGKQKYQNYLETLAQDLEYIDANLFHKLGGFSSKEKLQINIDSVDPVSRSPGVILPPEDYSLFLNVSNPIKILSISGIIVQRSNDKFLVSGYDSIKPYFKILQPIKTAASGSITVGGKSESFTEWSGSSNETNKGLNSVDTTTANSVTTRYYKQGQLVRYNGLFYRTKVGHTAQDTFNDKLFQPLPLLPIKGGVTVILPVKYETDVTLIPYGTEYETVQEVYDLILGYGAWLESQGFEFNEFNTDLAEVINWKFSGKEFLYWSIQSWSNNSVITLSPFSDYLKFTSSISVVDNIVSAEYSYKLLKADGKLYPIDKFNFSREDGYCTIKTLDPNEGMFFAELRLVQKEHAMVFNNSTIFNDTIYDIETGYKQQRIKLSGFRTKEWNGDYLSPGFVYDAVNIKDWTPYTVYLPGSVVRYNSIYYQSIGQIEPSITFNFTEWAKLNEKPYSELIPNFDYKINQFEDFYSLDIDNFDYAQQQLAQHLVGYVPRIYLNNIFPNPISQYKFYQGFIKEKGTKKAIDKLAKANEYGRNNSVLINEEWAFRVGHYGSYSTYKELEINLEEGSYLENPYVVKFVDSIPADPNPLINFITPNTLLITPEDYAPASTFNVYDSTFDDNNIELLSAGYARINDVTATAFSKNSILDIANNNAINEGDTIWVGFLENGNWDIFRYTKENARITGVYVSSPGVDITFVTDINHELEIGEIVSVVRFNDQVNGVYTVKSISNLKQFTVSSVLTTIEDAELLSPGLLFKFRSVRFDNINELASKSILLNLKDNDKLWVDKDVNSKWVVYQKVDNYSSLEYNSIDIYGDQRIGSNIYTSESTNIVLVSAPGKWQPGDASFGKIIVYKKINDILERQYEYGVNDKNKTYCNTATITNFGNSLVYDEGKSLFIAGAPAASNIRATTSTGIVILSTGTGTAKSFTNEGIVKISSKKANSLEDETKAILVNPFAATTATAQNSRFGQSIYINQTAASTSTLLLVGSPGTTGYLGSGKVLAYVINTVINTTTNITNVNIQAHPVGLQVNADISLTPGSMWGNKITGDRLGNRIAVSAPGYISTTTGYTGFVQIFNKNLVPIQRISTPFDSIDTFGYDVVVSSSGNYLFVSSIDAQCNNSSYGKVAVYYKQSSSYELLQIIDNPLSNTQMKFGYSLSISEDENTLSISALGVSNSQETNFVGDDESVIFDSNATEFVSIISNAGTVFVYNKLGNYYVLSTELDDVVILNDSKYGISVATTNDVIYVGAPSYANSTLDSLLIPDNSKFYQFSKIDKSTNGYKILRQQASEVEINKVKRIALIDTLNEEIVEYLDVIDPLKGKISGLAEQELKFKSTLDPAVYSLGISITTIDTETNWLDEHVGELWWDLSTAKFIWYEQGDDLYRKNNWGKLFPGASIDVYEWVKSDLLPSEWAAQADTNQGLTKGISGQPKYPDNSVISAKQVYNNVTGVFENVYYFWVKNKTLIPNVKNRRISAYTVATYIADPVAAGLKFAEVLSKDSIAFANIQPMLVSNTINVNIVTDDINNQIPKHTEWLLLEDGNAKSVPTTLLEKKLIDSLLGHDAFGNSVPSANLTYRNKYGLGIRPQQSLFKNRIEALRNVVEFSNKILLENKITGNYSFTNLEKQEEIPDIFLREYDDIFDDRVELTAYNTDSFVQAELECFILNGKIRNVIIRNAGFGYKQPPLVSIIADVKSDANIETTINSAGQVSNVTIVAAGNGFTVAPTLKVRPHTVIISTDDTAGNKWTKNYFNYSATTEENKWIKEKTQTYNTPLYWNYVNWVSKEYSSYKNITNVVPSRFELSTLSDVQTGDYVKVSNYGNSKYLILERTADDIVGDYTPEYNVVYIEDGTIQIKDNLWNFSLGQYSYDLLTLDETLYDQIPDLEIYYILQALKEDIFVRNLKVNWNLLFFKAVKYAMSEQKLLDWAFKTSFINVKNIIGDLDQRPVYKLDSDQYFEEYIKEVKPYHTKIRNYIPTYLSQDTADLRVTDFDLPPYLLGSSNTASVIQINSNIPKSSFTITNTLTNVYPWKSWADYYTYYVSEVLVAEPGVGYTETPTVTISAPNDIAGTTATGIAYLRNGGIYRVEITNPGSGYFAQPSITIAGGGSYVTKQATASVILKNDTIRKNLLGIKFDRIVLKNEINLDPYTDTFNCDGNTTNFELSWLATPDKKDIVPSLDGKTVFAADYTLEYSERKNKYTIFKFLNYVPKEGQVFKIVYKKNINLLTAVERINTFYSPSETMPAVELPLLMTGAEYGNTVIQGLPFKYAAPWSLPDIKYGEFAWDDLVDNYAFAKIITTATSGTNTLVLNTTTGIVPGQILNILNTSTKNIRDFTVVDSVNTASNSITISSPKYSLRYVRSTATSVGSTIVIKTTRPFNGNIVTGDIIKLSNMSVSGYNGTYVVDYIDSNDTLTIKANSLLGSTMTTSLVSSQIEVVTLLSDIKSNNVLLDKIISTVTNVTSTSILTYSSINDISSLNVSVNNIAISTSTATTPYYNLVSTNALINRSAVNIFGLTTVTNTIAISMFTDPKIEFWKTNTLQIELDTAISGGSWSGTNFVGALGVSPEELIVNGENFLSYNSDFAPEEFVPGHVLDSLGINVYTRTKKSNPTVITGTIPGPIAQTSTFTISSSFDLEATAGIMVYSNGTIFNRINDTNFTAANQFYLYGNEITLPVQPAWSRVGYTIVLTGGENVLDSNMVAVENTSSAIVQSLVSISDVASVYVTVNGIQMSVFNTLTNTGYVLAPAHNFNNRASVIVYGLTAITSTVEAWFFNLPYDTFNRMREEIFTVSSANSLSLNFPPSNIKPYSSQVIVEIKSNLSTTSRRMLPPKVSYYTIKNNQQVFAIDSKTIIPPSYFTNEQIKVYLNGIEIIPGIDYTVDLIANTITLTYGLFNNNDFIAILTVKDYEYYLENNLLTFANTVTNSTIKVTTFSDHDDLKIYTERFTQVPYNRYKLDRPIFNDSYVWVYVNGIPLINKYDFRILDDQQTVEFGEWIITTSSDVVLITSIGEPNPNYQILGFRVFKDIFDRQEFKRLTNYHSTYLTKELRHFDTEIHVESNDELITPNPQLNIPGVIIVDGERIEFLEKAGNTLRHLRRSTLGTGPAHISYPGTVVIDQSIQQTIPYVEKTYVQKIPTSNTTTYVITTATTTATGDGIVLIPNVDAVHQIFVYFGGRQLRKSPLVVHDIEYSYDPTPASLRTLMPEFSVNTSTRQLILNINEAITTGTDITIIHKKGYVWTGTESLLTSNVAQAEFLRRKQAVLPSVYYYGGNKDLTNESYFEMTDENDNPLEE